MIQALQNLERLKLSNGLTVLLLEARRLPIVLMDIFVRSGSAQNPMGMAGLAALTSRLLDEGTEHYDAEQFARQVEDLGGGLSTFSQREMTGVLFQVEPGGVTQAIELASEMIQRPRFPLDRLAREKRRVLQHIGAIEDDPQLVGSLLFAEEVYRGTSLQFPVLGTKESVASLDQSDVERFHSTHFQPENSLIVVVGDFNRAAVVGQLEDQFGQWSQRVIGAPGGPDIMRQTEPRKRNREMQREQSHLFLGHLGIPRAHPDYHLLQILDVILGGGPGLTSRIPRRIRDEQGLAYSTYSELTQTAGTYPGVFMAYACTSPENRDRAATAILSEIEDIQQSPIAEEELRVAQEYLTGSFVFDFQSNSDVARYLLQAELYRLGDDYPERYPELIRGASAEGITCVARQHLDTLNYTSVIVGPQNGKRRFE